ncbi:MAG TPA: hypothetical protein VJ885_18595, partial [Thermoanaerobaculia bacterium]|nr:hypothetical protein [Thermoanaerobaculia bacterium]
MAHRLVGVFLCVLSLVSAASRAQTITFVDQGAPATVLLDGGPARVRVVDPAANTGPGRDSVAATVSSGLAGDFESLTLLETGPGTGVFEGVVTLYPAGSSAPPITPKLATATSSGSQPSRDILQATYPVSGATATAGLMGSILRFVDDWGRESASFAAGHVLNLRVRDQMRNDHRSRDSFTVTFTSQAGDSEMVLVQETGMSTGVFEGILSTTRTASSPGNGLLRVGTPDSVTATLAASDGVTTASAQAQIARSVTRLLDSEGKPVDSYLEKARVRIQVVDPAVSGSSVTVQVTSGSGDFESLILPGGFGFEGEIATEPTFASAVPGDGVLQIVPSHDIAPQSDTVTATYTAGGSSDSAPFVAGRLSFVDARGRETSSLPLGSEVHVRLERLRSNSPSLDTVAVRVTNPANWNEEYLVLTETRRDSGEFTGSLPLDELDAQVGDQILASHAESVIEVSATVTDRALEFLDEQGEPTDEIVESGPARVRMHSTLDNGNPSSADSAAVEMRVLLSNDLETLTLTETGPDTDVFEGTIRLEMGSF